MLASYRNVKCPLGVCILGWLSIFLSFPQTHSVPQITALQYAGQAGMMLQKVV